VRNAKEGEEEEEEEERRRRKKRQGTVGCDTVP